MPSRAERSARVDVELNDKVVELKRVSSELAMTQDTLKTTQDTLKMRQSVLSKMQFQMNFRLEKAAFMNEDHDVNPLCTPLPSSRRDDDHGPTGGAGMGGLTA